MARKTSTKKHLREIRAIIDAEGCEVLEENLQRRNGHWSFRLRHPLRREGFQIFCSATPKNHRAGQNMFRQTLRRKIDGVEP